MRITRPYYNCIRKHTIVSNQYLRIIFLSIYVNFLSKCSMVSHIYSYIIAFCPKTTTFTYIHILTKLNNIIIADYAK